MPNHPHLTRPATLSNDVRRRRLWLLIGALHWQQRWSDRLLDQLAPALRRRATTRYPGLAERLSRAVLRDSYQ